jgi:hypothetical protein
MLPKLNQKRALFVLTRIDEIMAWERGLRERGDTRFVELGRYVCEVSTGQYWRVEKLKSFDEFLARRFSESRQAYYFMSVQEHLPPQARKELKEELAKVARRDGQEFEFNLAAQGALIAKGSVQAGSGEERARVGKS